jgi:hypothetical protein
MMAQFMTKDEREAITSDLGTPGETSVHIHIPGSAQLHGAGIDRVIGPKSFDSERGPVSFLDHGTVKRLDLVDDIIEILFRNI